MKQRQPTQMRDFKCPECGTVTAAPKYKGKRTGKGHIKHMWCFRCEKTTGHIQVSG